MNSMVNLLRRLFCGIGFLTVLGYHGASTGAPLAIAQDPMFLTVNMAPNVVMTIDDSASMMSAYLPESLYTADYSNSREGVTISPSRRYKSSNFNPIYYNPVVTYTIPTRSDGVTYSTSFTAAYVNGFDTSKGSKNLSSDYRPTVDLTNDVSRHTFALNPSADFISSKRAVGVDAYYYLFDSSLSNCDGTSGDDDCYKYVKVGSPQDIFNGATSAKQQNFAIWYSFYRTRALATISGAMTAISGVSNNEIRLAWQSLGDYTDTKKCNSFGSGSYSCKNYNDTSFDNRMRVLSASHRTNFFNWLHRFMLPANSGTPLRDATERVGDYFSTSGVNSPYAQDPQVSVGTEYGCRKNYHILMTDGIWNNDSTSVGNTDNTAATLPDGTSYSARRPYLDSNSNSLADLAFNYWATDLRPTLTNNILPYLADRSGTATDQYWNPRNDPATWQHVVTFTLSLGLDEVLLNPVWAGSTYAGDYSAILTGSKNWPTTGSNLAGNAYDLWHAAINSRGQFFNASDPAAMTSAFQSILRVVKDATPSSAALSANSTSIQTGTLVYQAKFDSKDWTGTLLAFPVQGDGSIGSVQWDAATLVPAHASRQIFTYVNSDGRTFDSCTGGNYAGLAAVLNRNASGVVDSQCAERLAWLRGNSVNEVRNGGTFRNRTNGVMGDIINSDPAFVKAEDYGYANLPTSAAERTTYAAFVAGNASRVPVVYVGGNDGMLHAIRADIGNANSGKELFAYVPAGVYGNLSALTDPNYTHRYYVDGAPTAGDAYIDGDWATVLVGGLNSGGKTIYALNITDPVNFAAGNVLWEYTETDMGLSYSQPQIARLNNGDWAAIFGNGYNSPNEHPYLYIVNLETGVLIKKIAAGSLCSTPPCSNGLSTPYLHDSNNDKIIDVVYAGDLQGNMWKFDLSDASSSNWDVAFSGSPLFTARNASGDVQPITSQPKVTAHPTSGYLVYFGTGRYLTNVLTDNDLTNASIQTFYAIWDNGSPITTTNRSNLLAQTITFQGQVSKTDPDGNIVTNDVRTTSQNAVDWATHKGWYLDLVEPSPASPRGERVVSTSIVKGGRIIFVTLIPNSDPCSPGGESWLMEIDTLTGGALSESVFDLNNDDLFDTADLVNSHVVAGVKSTVGISKTPVWLDKDSEIAFKELSGTSGGIATIKNKGAGGGGGSVGRVYWMQIL